MLGSKAEVAMELEPTEEMRRRLDRIPRRQLGLLL